tara:strand:- start:6 stop:203 length:198 start_codon:yes stop_codon:yes gene_type:complete
VAIILREEDKKPSGMKLARKMPQGWSWGDDEFARYKTAGIELSREKLLIEGSSADENYFFYEVSN